MHFIECAQALVAQTRSMDVEPNGPDGPMSGVLGLFATQRDFADG